MLHSVASAEVPYLKHCRSLSELEVGKVHIWKIIGGVPDLCQLLLGVTSKSYFTVISTTTYILLPACERGIFTNSIHVDFFNLPT